jgi:predicted anti-sigma-YlaC factor YlaD
VAGADLFAGEHLQPALNRVRHLTHKRTALDCRHVKALLAGMLAGDARISPTVESHVASCLSCQAELARYRRLLRLMRQLNALELAMPPGILAEVLSALEVAAKRRASSGLLTGKAMAYGLALLGAVGASVAVFLLARRPEQTGDEADVTGAIVMAPR